MITDEQISIACAAYDSSDVAHSQIAAMRKALEAYEQSKPKPEPLNLDHYDTGLFGGSSLCDVSWWHNYLRVELERAHDYYQSQVDCLTQYTTPPTREPLSEVEILKLALRDCYPIQFVDRSYGITLDKVTVVDFARLIEQAHGIGVKA